MSAPRFECAGCGRTLAGRGRFPRFGPHNVSTRRGAEFCRGSFREPETVRRDVLLERGEAASVPAEHLADLVRASLPCQDYDPEPDDLEMLALAELERRATLA